MAITHVVFHLPAGLIGIAFYQILSTPGSLRFVTPMWTIYLLSMSVSVFGSLADFFIYLYAFPAFRDNARRLISRTCLICIFNTRQETFDQTGEMAITGKRSINDLKFDGNTTLKQLSSFNSTATF